MNGNDITRHIYKMKKFPRENVILLDQKDSRLSHKIIFNSSSYSPQNKREIGHLQPTLQRHSIL